MSSLPPAIPQASVTAHNGQATCGSVLPLRDTERQQISVTALRLPLCNWQKAGIDHSQLANYQLLETVTGFEPEEFALKAEPEFCCECMIFSGLWFQCF